MPTDFIRHSKLLRVVPLLLCVLANQFVSRKKLWLKTPINLITSHTKCYFLILAYLWLQCWSQETIPAETMAVGKWLPSSLAWKVSDKFNLAFSRGILAPGVRQVASATQLDRCATFGEPEPNSAMLWLLLRSLLLFLLRQRMSVLSKVPMPCSSLPIMPPKYQFPHHSSVSEGISGCLKSLINFYVAF